MSYQVQKRDGKNVDFKLEKISRVIKLAFDACNKNYNDSIIDLLTLKVTADFESKIKENLISVEDIQDSVETVLSKAGYEDVAKEYILYRNHHKKIRDIEKTKIDCIDIANQYLDQSDWRVKENSTVNYCVGGLILNQSGAMTSNYWLNEIYDKPIADAHRNCDMHIHDLCMLSPYCCGHDLKQLILEGLSGVKGKISSAPAGHLSTLCNQMVNYLGILQNEWAKLVTLVHYKKTVNLYI